MALKVLDLNSVLQNLANMLPRLLGETWFLESSYGRMAFDRGGHRPCSNRS